MPRKPHITRLFAANLRSALQPLLADDRFLGKADRDRAVALSTIAVAETTRLSECLTALFPGQPTARALTNLRGFRMRLNDAAKETKLLLRFHSDSGTRTPTTERFCWFTGQDPIVENAERFSDQSTADVLRKTVIPASGVPRARSPEKRLVRFFVSYAHADETLATALMTELRRQFKPSARYELDLWADRRVWADERIAAGDLWHDEIQRALGDCDFGLLLVSPAFLGSDYIGAHELPRFVGESDGSERKPVVPVGLVKVDFDRHALKGLERHQLFLRHVAVSGAHRFYADCDGTREKRRFAEALFCDIEERLDHWFAPDSTRSRKPGTTSDDDADDKPAEADLRGPADRFAAEAAGTEPPAWTPPRGVPTTHGEVEAGRTDAGDKQAVDAVQFIITWAKRPDDAPFLALLGEYGIGKTTTLQQVTRELLAEREKGNLEVPLPIYLDLRLLDLGDKSRVPALDVILADLIRKSWKLTDREQSRLTPADIVRLVREENALVIFDGLDEKLVHFTPDRGGHFIRELWSLLPPAVLRERAVGCGKVVLSCRSHYFRDVWSQRATLCGEDREGFEADKDYRLFLMLPFSEEQIRSYLARALREADDTDESAAERARVAFELIGSIHDLRGLAERPYLLWLISQQIEELETLQVRGETVNAARLYDLVVKRWLGRDDGKHQINPAHKRELMERLAAAMWTDGAKEWSADRLEAWLDTFLLKTPRIASTYAGRDRDVLKEDLRTATFVLRPDTSQEGFRFAHTSLQEFFLASGLVRTLHEGTEDGWDVPTPSRETIAFVGQLLATDTRRSAALATLERILGHPPLRAALNAFRYWLAAITSGWPEPQPAHVDLHGADLSEWEIAGRNAAHPLVLRGANLARADLSRSRLRWVDLSGADLTRTAARQAVFQDVLAANAVADEADLEALVWRHGTATGLRAATARLAGSEWIDVDAAEVSWPESTTGPAVRCAPHDPTACVDAASAEWVERLGHSAAVAACAFAPDGRTVLSGAGDWTLRLWDVTSGRCLRTFAGHTDWIRTCAFAPDGRTVLSGADDRTLRLWDVASGRCLRTFAGHTDWIRTSAFAPDGRTVLSGADDRTLRLWDAASGHCLRSFAGHAGAVMACAFAPDGRFVLSGANDRTLRLWDIATGQRLRTFTGHTHAVTACAFAPNGHIVLSGAIDRTLRLWDVLTGRCLRTFAGHTNAVTTCAIAPDGRSVLSGAADRTLRLWEVGSGRCLRTYAGHALGVTVCAFAPDERTVLSGAGDRTLRLWEVSSGRCIRSFAGHTCAETVCTFAPDGRTVLSGTTDRTLRLWDVASGRCLRTFSGHLSAVTACAFAPNGRTVLSGATDRTLRLWDIASGRCLRTFSGHLSGVTACAFAPDGRTVLSGAADRTLRLWDVASGSCLRTFAGHTDWIRTCAFAPDGRTALSGAHDKMLRLWDVASGRCLHSFAGHASTVAACAFTPDGRTVLSGAHDKTLRLWDIARGRHLRTFAGHTSMVTACAFAPDGRTMLSGAHDKTLRLWDVASGHCLHTFAGHKSEVTACAFAPDGRTVLSGAYDRTLQLWDVASAKCLRMFRHLPRGEADAIDAVSNRPLWLSEGAWEYSGWRVWEEPDQRWRLLPAEYFGPLPTD